jgi:hypothetical protein
MNDVIRTSKPSNKLNRLLANIVHAVLHILDDSEENAQTGIVTLEISKDDWVELNRVIELISDDPHETLHDLINVNEPPALPEINDPDLNLSWQTFLKNQAMLTSTTLLIAHAAFVASWYAAKAPSGETCEQLGQESWRLSLPVITVQMLADYGQEGFFEKTDQPVKGVAGVSWSQAAVDFACMLQTQLQERLQLKAGASPNDAVRWICGKCSTVNSNADLHCCVKSCKGCRPFGWANTVSER